MPPRKSLLRTMSPKRSRLESPEQDDRAVLERKGSLRGRSNSLRGGLRLKQKTHEAPGTEDDEAFKREWGMSQAAEDDLIRQFREQLKQAGVLNPNTDWYFLRRFLRARQHDLKRAKDMYATSMRWRAEFGADTILDDFKFAERDAFISLYPQGYHKTDKLVHLLALRGRPIYVQHLGAINYKKMQEVTTDERMIKFHVQEYERCARVIMPACSIVAGRHIDQTFAIIDVKGVGLKHLTGEVKRMLSKITGIDQNNYPEMLGHTCIINAPGIFKIIWSAIKGFIDPKTQEKIEVCPRDYTSVLLQWVDPESLPEYLGGTSKATLLDDAGPWQDPKILAQVEANNARIRGVGGKHISEESGDEAEGGRADQNGLRVASKEAAASPEPGGGARFADVPPIMTRRSSSIRSDLSGDDDAFYSPKSNGSFTSDASFSSAAEYLGRSPSEELEGSQNAGGADIDREGSGALAQASSGDAKLSIPILSRVRALEERVPGLQAKLRRHLKKGAHGASVGGAPTLAGRVEALEEAVDALLIAQEAQLEHGGEAKKGACCGCCALM